jgi:hypothetical protein
MHTRAELAYAFHAGRASAYGQAGNKRKARKHRRRARYYAAFGAAGKKTHHVFVLSPLNAKAQESLESEVAKYASFEQTIVYIQGFSEPDMKVFAPVCPKGADGEFPSSCKNVLPAQFNQYCSDDPLALVKLIGKYKSNEKVRFVIFPTQLTKNKTFDTALKADLKDLIVKSWGKLGKQMQRKFVAWCTPEPALATRPKTTEEMERRLVGFNPETLEMKTLFDPFVAFYAARTNRAKTQHVEAFDGPNRMPSLRPADTGNVEVVYHETTEDAASDAKAYAEYVAKALTERIDNRPDSDATDEITAFQDHADYDNPIGVRCILSSFSGPVRLYSVGRPVESAGCGDAIKYGKWNGEHVHGSAPTWPPCTHIDAEKSAREAVNVAATWVIVLANWLMKASAPNRTITVRNCGYPLRHGMNPKLHSAIVDIFTLYDDGYLPFPGEYEQLKKELTTKLEKMEAVDVADYFIRPGDF